MSNSKRDELVTRYINATDSVSNMTTTIQLMINNLVGLSSKEKEHMSVVLKECIDINEILNLLKPIYASYEDDELEAAVDFYESDVGQRVIKRQPVVATAMHSIISNYMSTKSKVMLDRFESLMDDDIKLEDLEVS